MKDETAALSDAVQFIESTDRALVPLILKLDRHIDLVIPRGGESLIRAVVAESTIPVLKHYTGNCHIYVDKATDGMEQLVKNVCVNAKTSYPGGAVCNAVEHILIHKDAAQRLLKPVCEALAAKEVEVRGFADGRVIDHHQIEAGGEIGEGRVGEGLQRALLPVDEDAGMQLREALRSGDHGEVAASVVPRNAGEFDHVLAATPCLGCEAMVHRAKFAGCMSTRLIPRSGMERTYERRDVL